MIKREDAVKAREIRAQIQQQYEDQQNQLANAGAAADIYSKLSNAAANSGQAMAGGANG